MGDHCRGGGGKLFLLLSLSTFLAFKHESSPPISHRRASQPNLPHSCVYLEFGDEADPNGRRTAGWLVADVPEKADVSLSCGMTHKKKLIKRG